MKINPRFFPVRQTVTALSALMLLTATPALARDWSAGGSFYPELVADVAERVAPSVVNIDVERSANQGGPQGSIPGFPLNDEILRKFFGFDESLPGGGPFFPFKQFGAPGGQGGLSPRTIAGNGSGFILSKDGYILTNNHVVSSADKITVTLQDGRKLPARLIGRDGYSDVAVLKVDAPNLTPVVMANSKKLRPGEWVLAVGSPLGFDHTVTLGIVSATSRHIPDLNSNVDFIQTDAAINPGNSGGPLVNLKGEVVGVNTAISGRGQNIGFAIPSEIIQQVSNQLIAGGKITRPWIGLSMANLSPELLKSLGLPETTEGVVVAQVLQNSPAAKAGFQQGDVIQRIDGQAMADAAKVQELVKQRPLNSTLSVQILRNGRLMPLSITTEQLPDDPQEALQTQRSRVIPPAMIR